MYWHSAMYRARRRRFFMFMRMARMNRMRAYLMAFYDPSDTGRTHEYRQEGVRYHRYPDDDLILRIRSGTSRGLEAEGVQL